MNDKPPDSGPRQGMDYGEQAEVQEVHAAIQREKREPRVGLEPLSIWLIAVYGLAIFCAGAYLGRYSGSFSGDSLDPMTGPPPTKKGVTTGSWTAGGAFSARSRQKDFRRELSDVSSGQRPRHSGTISAARRVGVHERRFASHGNDCAQRLARTGQSERSTVRHRGDATVGQNADRPKNRRCHDLRAQ